MATTEQILSALRRCTSWERVVEELSIPKAVVGKVAVLHAFRTGTNLGNGRQMQMLSRIVTGERHANEWLTEAELTQERNARVLRLAAYQEEMRASHAAARVAPSAPRPAARTTAMPIPASPVDLLSRMDRAVQPSPVPALVQVPSEPSPAAAPRGASPLSPQEAASLLITLGSDIRIAQETLETMDRLSAKYGANLWANLRTVKQRCGGWQGVLDLSQRLGGLLPTSGESSPPSPPPPPQVRQRVAVPIPPAQAVRESLGEGEELADEEEETEEGLTLPQPRGNYTVLYHHDNQMVLVFRPSVRTIFVQGTRGANRHRSHRLAFPWMVFGVNFGERAGINSYVASRLTIGCSATEPTGLGSLFDVPMLGNTDRDGHVCTGIDPMVGDDPEALAVEMVSHFWQSEFNSDITGIGANVRSLRQISALAESDPEEARRMLPTFGVSITLRQLLHLNVRQFRRRSNS